MADFLTAAFSTAACSGTGPTCPFFYPQLSRLIPAFLPEADKAIEVNVIVVGRPKDGKLVKTMAQLNTSSGQGDYVICFMTLIS